MNKNQNKVRVDIERPQNFELSGQLESTSFSKAKIYIMYSGLNANGSFISKETVDRATNTLYNKPIVGEFNESTQNFKDHGGKVEITNDSIAYTDTTKPLGVIPESAEIYWETDDGGKDWLVVDKALIWNRYYDETEALLNDTYGQSMEIEVISYSSESPDSVIYIDDFEFSALCVLGIEKNGDERVKPAFDESRIITYSKKTISEMQDMYNELLTFTRKDFADGEEILIQDEEGDLLDSEETKVVDENQTLLDTIAQAKLSLQDVASLLEQIGVSEDEETDAEQEDKILGDEDISLVEDSIARIEVIKNELQAVVDYDGGTEFVLKKEFEVEQDSGAESKDDEEQSADEEKGAPEEQIVIEKPLHSESDDEESQEDSQAKEGAVGETAGDVEGSSVGTQVSEVAAQAVENVDLDANNFPTEDFDSMKQELEELRAYKRESEISQAKDKVEEFKTNYDLSDEDVKDINVETVDSMESLENQLFSIVGKKVAKEKSDENNFSLNGSPNKITFSRNEPGESTSGVSYGSLIEENTKK